MKSVTISLLAGVAVVLTACVVTSVYPFYSEKDVAFEPALLGSWTNTTSPEQHWKFEKEGESAYRLTCTEDGKPSVMRAQPFKLQGQLFLDLSRNIAEEEPFPPSIPSHVLLRVLQTSPNLRMAILKYDWLSELLEKDPKALRYHVIKPNDKPEDRYFVLTANTEELRQFIIKHLKTDAVWKDEFELKHAAATVPAGPRK